MYADITKPPPPLPTAELKTIRQGVSLLPPLSRRGHGPGLIILTQATADPFAFYEGVPSLLVKWAEGGYTVVQLEPSAFEGRSSEETLKEATEALAQCDKCEPKESIGLVAYGSDLWNKAATGLAQVTSIVASIVYTDASAVEGLASTRSPVLRHISGQNTAPKPASKDITQYCYPQVKSCAFASPDHDHFHYTTESLSHTRGLQFLKPRINGPYFDLETIWDEHTYYEFADRSIEHTMSTMVQEPYVNHMPTITGGIGRDKLSNFYRHNFIFNNSTDTELVSCTTMASTKAGRDSFRG